MQHASMSYQWNAGDYAQHSAGQERWARELLPLLGLRLDDRVLDIGCGDGRITSVIASLVPNGHVVGIDSSAEMITHATAATRSIPNLTFQQRDALNLDFSEEFTAIFSNAVLHWIRNQARVVEQIARALRPSGRVLVQCGGEGNGQGVIDSFTTVAAKDSWREYFQNFESTYGFYSDRDYGRWLKEAGLIVDDLRLIPKDMVHADVAAFQGWLRTAWHPYTSRVPENARTGFIEEVTRDYLRTFPADTSGNLHVTMIRLQFLAHKPA
jgi:trans-aconitate 2-methyltransferase